jgi:hypothetical protein
VSGSCQILKCAKEIIIIIIIFNGLASGVGRENEVLYFALECPPNNSDNLLVDTGFHLLARSFFEV